MLAGVRKKLGRYESSMKGVTRLDIATARMSELSKHDY